MKTTGFFQVRHADGSIEKSMGRLLAFISTVTGVLVVFLGIALNRIEVVMAGAGLIGSGELLKYGSKRVEK